MMVTKLFCDQKFDRYDAFARHQLAHQGVDIEKELHQFGSSFRACLTCVTSRKKCSGSLPCQRCSERGIECGYPKGAKREGRARRPPEHKCLNLKLPGRLLSNLPNSPELETMDTSSAYEPHSQSSPGFRVQPQNDSKQTEKPSPYQFSNMVFSPHELGSLEGDDQRQLRDQSQAFPWPRQRNCTQQTLHPPTLPHNNDLPLESLLDIDMATNISYQTAQLSSVRSFTTGTLCLTSFEYDQLMFDNQDDNQDLTVNNLGFLEPLHQPSVQLGLALPIYQGHGETSKRVPKIIELNDLAATKGFWPGCSPPVQLQSHPNKESKFSTHINNGSRPNSRSGIPGKSRVNKKTAPLRLPNLPSRKEDNHFSFPIAVELQMSRYDTPAEALLAPQTYDRLLAEFKDDCFTASNRFVSEQLPSFEFIGFCLHLFFENWHATFPLLHKPSMRADQNGWLLVLCIAGIGVRHLDNEDARQCSEAFLEFLKRSLGQIEDTIASSDQNGDGERLSTLDDQLAVIQARILSTAATFHSWEGRPVKQASTQRSKPVTSPLNRQGDPDLTRREVKKLKERDEDRAEGTSTKSWIRARYRGFVSWGKTLTCRGWC
ncbi:uncharacterized protein PAC_17418 [Phialocephala subalpina]|uniref:Zn(2)-C6 fungal-type domain-containing protein n=1 Tax=Phialocephala subalpina TaxID=576137 RepID=A0A1L7XR85_9HELO|nr:uncharacterized protein PAC_17418 [Phialocephala subalpina]